MKIQDLQAMFSGPLLIEPDALQAALAPLFAGGDVLAAAQAAAASGPRTPTVTAGGVAIVPISGVIMHRASWITELFGWSTAEGITNLVRQLGGDSGVRAIFYDVSSPGGTVDGVSEAAAAIYALRGKKVQVAISRNLMASAAYWMGSAADSVVGAPLSQTGSIGVWTMHIDESKWLEAEGVKVSLISAGKYKVEGNSFEPLSEEARAFIQSQVNAVYAAFTEAVARHRGVRAGAVRSGYGEGRCLIDQQAKAAGLIDRVATWEDVLFKLQGRKGGAQAADAHLSPEASAEWPEIEEGLASMAAVVEALPPVVPEAQEGEPTVEALAEERAEAATPPAEPEVEAEATDFDLAIEQEQAALRARLAEVT